MASQIALEVNVAEFAVGFAAGYIVLSAVLIIRAFRQVVLASLALAIAFILFERGVPGLVRSAGDIVEYLAEFSTFAHGLLTGKFAASILTWHGRRRKQRGQQ